MNVASFLLAVWGATVATVLGLLRVVEFVRERPRVRVEMRAELHEDGARLLVEVATAGRQTTIDQVGLAFKNDPPVPRIPPPEVPGLPAHAHLTAQDRLFVWGVFPGDEPKTIEPWGMYRFERDLDEKPLPIHVDTPMRPFVRTSDQRHAWGERGFAFLRGLVDLGWNPPAVFTADLLVPLPRPPNLPRVVSRWKLWAPRGLRSSDPDPALDSVRRYVIR